MTTVFGSLDVGAALGLVICGPLIRAAGWPAVFYLFAALGLVWCLAWPLLQPEREPDAAPPPAPASAGTAASGSSIDEAGAEALRASRCPANIMAGH